MKFTCTKCNKEKDSLYFHRNKARPNGLQAECKSCQLDTNRNNSVNKKLKMMEYKGGKCQRCNGIFDPEVFEFHHRNPKEKEYQPRAMQYWKWEKIVPELDKCDMLCANCHRITHKEMREHG